MPRTARLDIAGVLQHVMVRGIERREIFLDDQDRRSFLDRFNPLLDKLQVDCFAWALMPNHFHLLLRPAQNNLAQFMRRLLTGYAVSFNLRHHRSGHLFQNRYKSIVCEEDPYLLELVRYIHLNPLRAGIVTTVKQLKSYPWTGHAVIMGAKEMAGQKADEVLMYFGRKRRNAQEKYEDFVVDGVHLGKRPELVGGGLRRVLEAAGNDVVTAYDDRVLGSGDFVEDLRHEREVNERLEIRLPLSEVIGEIAALAGIDSSAICERRRGAGLSEAKGVICYVATRRLGFSGEVVAKALGITRSGVCRGALRGGNLLLENLALKDAVEKLLNRSTTSP